jgi:tetratricopeptide (TPR) repeat protein
MKDLSGILRELLDRQLQTQGYSVDLVPIPRKGDRNLAIRTLEEALDEIDRDPTGDSIGYMIQVRPSQVSKHPLADPTAVLAERESVYLPDGKLNSGFLFKNAELLFNSKDFALARSIYSAILKSGEKSGLCHYWIGRCHEAEGRSSEAMASYEESIAFQPNLEAYQRYAVLLIKTQKDHQAAEVLERALTCIKDIPTSVRLSLYKTAGNSWLAVRQFKNAEACYLRAIEIDPKSDDVQANLGALYLQNRMIQEARIAFESALTTNPKNFQAISGLGSCAIAVNETRTAHDYFSKSLDLNIHQPTAVFHLIKAAYEIKSYATAARIVAEYSQVAPTNANLLYSLAGLQFHLGRLEESKVTVQRILELQPSHSGAIELLETMNRINGI